MLLYENPKLVFKRMKKGPLVNRGHRKKREGWAKARIGWTLEKLSKAIFSEEKLNVDGPDYLRSIGTAFEENRGFSPGGELEEDPSWFGGFLPPREVDSGDHGRPKELRSIRRYLEQPFAPVWCSTTRFPMDFSAGKCTYPCITTHRSVAFRAGH